MSTTELFRIWLTSLPIAINRSALQISSIIITAILGQINSVILAQFSLALAAASIFFILITAAQLAIQVEFAKEFAKEMYQKVSGLFWATLILITILSLGIAIFANQIFQPFSSIQEINLAKGASEGFLFLLVCLPLVAWATLIGHLLEACAQAALVAKIRIAQILLQVTLVALAAIGVINIPFLSPIENIMTMYILSDFIMLIVLINFGLKAGSLQKILFLMPDFYSIRLACRIGFPIIFGLCGQRYIFFFLTVSIGVLGSSYSAAFAIINSLMFFLQIPLLGWSHTATLEIGKTRGVKTITDVSRVLRITTIGASIILILSIFIYVVFKNYFFELFSNDTHVIALLQSLPLIIPAFFFLNGALIFIMAALRGYGDNMIPQMVLVLILLLGYVAPSYFTKLDLSFAGEIWHFVGIGGFASAMLLVRLFWLNSRELY